MRSVVLTRWRPDAPVSGAGLRNWQNIRALARLGPVDVVTIGSDDQPAVIEGVHEWTPFSMRDRSAWDRIKTTCWMLRPGTYPSFDAWHSGAIGAWLTRRAARRRYELAVIEGLAVASYMSDLRRVGCRMVFDAHNVEAELRRAVVRMRPDEDARTVRRAKDWILQRRLAAAEHRAVHAADIIWACSVDDATQIEGLYQVPRPAVIPNAIDVERYRRSGVQPPEDDWNGLPITMVYPGSLAYYPNEDAAMRLINHVLPAVRRFGGRARLVLVGRDPTPAMIAAARQDVDIEVTGPVPNVLPYLEQPSVMAIPMTLGSGTRLKILEAFAVGRPVVATGKGTEGLDAADGTHLLIRDDVESLARAVVEVWRDAERRAALCRNALHLVRERYSWEAASAGIARSLDPTLARDDAGRPRALPLPADHLVHT